MELPEREYFKIEAVARRWKCSQDDVLHLIETNKLVPSFRFKSVVCTKLISDGKKGWTEAAPLVSNGKIVPFHCSGLLTMCNSRRFWSKHYPITTEWESELAGEMFRAPDNAEPFFKSFQVQVNGSWKVTAADLLITMDEVLLFEAVHSPTAAKPEPAQMAQPPKPDTIKTATEKKQRGDALKKILIEITKDFQAQHKRTPTSIEVFNKVKALCRNRKHTVIQEVVEMEIHWKNAKNKDKITKYKQLQNRLTGINAV